MDAFTSFKDVPFEPGSPKNGDFNYPNCGAGISGEKCPYCGTVFYDFASFNLDRPQYVKIRYGGKIVACHVIGTGCEMSIAFYEHPKLRLELNMVPDTNGNMYTIIDEGNDLNG